MTARRIVIAEVLAAWDSYDDETRRLAGPLADLIDDALDIAEHEPGPVKVVRPDPSRAYEEVRVPGLIPWLRRRRRRAVSTGSASFPAKPVSVAPSASTEIPAAAIGTPSIDAVGRAEMRGLCADALIRAALLHRTGHRDLLFFNMREAWDAAALDFLGLESVDELVAEIEARRART